MENMSLNDKYNSIMYLDNNVTSSDIVRDEIKSMVSSVYKTVVKVSANSNLINSWTNRLYSKQTSLYGFLFSVISPKINLISISTLINLLFLSILGREATIIESSKLISVFNDELRKYGSKERALKKLLSYFVKISSIEKYCNKLNIRLM